MKAYADLEIGLHRRDAAGYAIELRFSQPESDADVRLARGSPALVQLDVDRLRGLALDEVAYGRALGEYLLADPEVQAAFRQARSAAQALEAPLRVRLFIGPSAPELHSLRWETIRDPQDGSLWLTDERVLFSRYLSSLDWQPVRLRPQGSLRALVVIANPTNLAEYQPDGRPLAPLDVDGELAQAKTSLGGLAVTTLASGGAATVNALSARLRNGYDILYLVCHGTLTRGEPWLWLEDETGRVARVAGGELATRLRELQHRPSLVVLASCQSAGRGQEAAGADAGALAAIGPRLAEVGIPAVLAMQGNVTIETMSAFLPTFFQELRRDGQIDRAVAAARGAVRHRPDWWMPVLFMRLRSGRIWYVPGFPDTFDKWPALLRSIRQGRSTPILGAGLIESLLGSTREIAKRWAETYHFPLAPHDRDDLPQVAQYLAINLDERFPRDELGEYLRQEIVSRYAEFLPEDARNAPLDDLLAAVETRRRAENPSEPYRALAELPFPIYITTNPDNLLAKALADRGKDPRVELCPWNEYVEQSRSIYQRDPDYRPDVQRPLVYHLFGELREPDSLVITEDDYFDYLIGVTSNKDLIPGVVRRALADTALLFLGFQMDDWNFRVLFRSLMGQEGRRRRSRYAHVAVQIDPEEGRLLDPERARRYLESYFQHADISIYWGTAEDFVHDLLARYRDDSTTDPSGR